jgi:hypothetical protein
MEDAIGFGILWFVVSSFIASFVIAKLANGRGRSEIGWFFFSMFCSPVVAGICLCAAKDGAAIESAAKDTVPADNPKRYTMKGGIDS